MSTHPTAASTAPETLAAVREVVATFLHLPADQVDDDLDLKAHGADSIDRVEILVTLRDRLGLHTPLAAFAQIPNLRALAEFLAAQTGAAR